MNSKSPIFFASVFLPGIKSSLCSLEKRIDLQFVNMSEKFSFEMTESILQSFFFLKSNSIHAALVE